MDTRLTVSIAHRHQWVRALLCVLGLLLALPTMAAKPGSIMDTKAGQQAAPTGVGSGSTSTSAWSSASDPAKATGTPGSVNWTAMFAKSEESEEEAPTSETFWPAFKGTPVASTDAASDEAASSKGAPSSEVPNDSVWAHVFGVVTDPETTADTDDYVPSGADSGASTDAAAQPDTENLDVAPEDEGLSITLTAEVTEDGETTHVRAHSFIRDTDARRRAIVDAWYTSLDAGERLQVLDATAEVRSNYAAVGVEISKVTSMGLVYGEDPFAGPSFSFRPYGSPRSAAYWLATLTPAERERVAQASDVVREAYADAGVAITTADARRIVRQTSRFVARFAARVTGHVMERSAAFGMGDAHSMYGEAFALVAGSMAAPGAILDGRTPGLPGAVDGSRLDMHIAHAEGGIRSADVLVEFAAARLGRVAAGGFTRGTDAFNNTRAGLEYIVGGALATFAYLSTGGNAQATSQAFMIGKHAVKEGWAKGNSLAPVVEVWAPAEGGYHDAAHHGTKDGYWRVNSQGIRFEPSTAQGAQDAVMSYIEKQGFSADANGDGEMSAQETLDSVNTTNGMWQKVEAKLKAAASEGRQVSEDEIYQWTEQAYVEETVKRHEEARAREQQEAADSSVDTESEAVEPADTDDSDDLAEDEETIAEPEEGCAPGPDDPFGDPEVTWNVRVTCVEWWCFGGPWVRLVRGQGDIIWVEPGREGGGEHDFDPTPPGDVDPEPERASAADVASVNAYFGINPQLVNPDNPFEAGGGLGSRGTFNNPHEPSDNEPWECPWQYIPPSSDRGTDDEDAENKDSIASVVGAMPGTAQSTDGCGFFYCPFDTHPMTGEPIVQTIPAPCEAPDADASNPASDHGDY